MNRLVRAAQAWRTRVNRPPRTLIPSAARYPGIRWELHKRPLDGRVNSYASEGLHPTEASESYGSYLLLPAFLSSLFGLGLAGVAHADANEASSEACLPSDSSPNHIDLEEIARKERRRLEQLLKDKGLHYGSYPRFSVAVKGQKVTIKFQVPPSCEIPHLIANLVSNLGMKVEELRAGSDMTLRAWDSNVAWQLTLNHLKKPTGGLGDSEIVNAHEQDLCILIFRSLISSDKAEVEFIKHGTFSLNELEALVSVLNLAGGSLRQSKTSKLRPRDEPRGTLPSEKSVGSLEALGVRVYGFDEPHMGYSISGTSWDNIAGYDQQKREIEETILMALHSPDIYDDIARGTRCKFETNRPRAVLFEGPPGTGKTSCARVISNQAGVPLVYVPLEVVMSKYYGESERLLGKVFSLANELSNGAIVFLDEVDSLATARDSEIHEATRRLLSVLLREIDGFEQDKKVVVIAATNRKQDLDPALISRFDSVITFGLPDHQNRQEIAAKYAKHLTKSELAQVAAVTEEMSGRDIKDVCIQAERRWASKIIRGQAAKEAEVSLPPLQEYIESAYNRKNALCSTEDRKIQNPAHNKARKQPLDLV